MSHSRGVVALGVAGTGKSRLLGARLASLISERSAQIRRVWFLSPVSEAFVAGFRENAKKAPPPIREGRPAEWAAEDLAEFGTRLRLATPAQIDAFMWWVAERAGLNQDSVRRAVRASRGRLVPHKLRSRTLAAAVEVYEGKLAHQGIFDDPSVLREWLWRNREDATPKAAGQVIVIDAIETATPIERAWLARKVEDGAIAMIAGDPAMASFEGEAGDLKRFVAMARKEQFGEVWEMRKARRFSRDSASIITRCLAHTPVWRHADFNEFVGETKVDVVDVESPEQETQAVLEAVKEGGDIAIITDEPCALDSLEAELIAHGIEYKRGQGSLLFHSGWRALAALLRVICNPDLQSLRDLIELIEFDRKAWLRAARDWGLPKDPSMAILENPESVRMTEHEAATIATWVVKAKGRGRVERLFPDIGTWLAQKIDNKAVARAIEGRMHWYADSEMSADAVIADVEAMIIVAPENLSRASMVAIGGIQLLTPEEGRHREWARVWVPGVGAGKKPGVEKKQQRMVACYAAISRARDHLTISGPGNGWAQDILCQN